MLLVEKHPHHVHIHINLLHSPSLLLLLLLLRLRLLLLLLLPLPLHVSTHHILHWMGTDQIIGIERCQQQTASSNHRRTGPLDPPSMIEQQPSREWSVCAKEWIHSTSIENGIFVSCLSMTNVEEELWREYWEWGTSRCHREDRCWTTYGLKE